MLARLWKMLSRNLSTFALSTSLLLVGCSQVPIYDDEWCIDLDPDGGSCFTTLSQKRRVLDQAEWAEFRKGRISGTPTAFAHLEEAIRKACIVAEDTSHKCSEQEKQLVEKKVKVFAEWREGVSSDFKERRKRRKK